MNYNYLMDSLEDSVGCEVNKTKLPITATLYNGKIKSDLNSRVEFKSISSVQSQLKFNKIESFFSNNFSETNLDDKKLRFSEKLKVLLKNGGNKNDLTDPYAFSEIDPQFNGPLNEALTTADSYIGRTSLIESKSNYISKNKNIMFSKAARPLLNDLVEGKDCNGETTYSKTKFNKIGVPVYATENSLVGNLNQSSFKLQHQESQADRFQASNGKNEQTAPSVQLASNNKPFFSKLIGKSKLQNMKPINGNNFIKSNSKHSSGKPLSFGHLQIQKQLNMKIDKKPDNKLKSIPKGKLLLNQLQKTALLNRSGSQVSRKNPPKPSFFGMSKNNQRDTDLTGSSGSNKSLNKKSLLEESLLGLKSLKNNANGITIKPRATDSDCIRSEHLKSVTETASATVLTSLKSRTDSLDQGKHESLQRIWNIRNKLKGLKRDHHHFGLTINDGDYDENSNSECLLFQNYWFSVCNDYDLVSNNDRRRDTKLSQLKVELRHKIKQLQWRYKDEYRDKVVELLVDSARKQPNLTAFLIRLENSKFNNRKKNTRVKPFNLLKPVFCSYINPELGEKCKEQAMPCIKFCKQHITCSNDQLLFTACSALRSDNTTCRAAVLNQNWENPLCLLHKRLENMSEIPKNLLNSKAVSRSSQPRKRSRSSTGSSSRSGRSRKRKRTSQKDKRDSLNEMDISRSNDSSTNFSFGKQNSGTVNGESFKTENVLTKITPQIVSKCDIDESQEVEVGEEVLAIVEDLPLELASQATKLLEEHDFTNVLNHIPADAFNDLFTEDKEEYEPTPQETEELERALEAVDKDVKSLEKLSQTQGILDTLLDEQTIAQTLAQLPEVTASLEVPQTLVPVFYQNGFSNINQLEQTLNDVNKSLTQTVLLNQGTDAITNHFVNNITIPNHADVLQS